MELQSVKQRFGIIGSNDQLNMALEIALRVATTDLSVLITGESGVGKEFFPQVIHAYSARKHGNYIAVNCGAIPEGTIDSELFGHEKGAFTGAIEARKGYFEMANEGTIFLDEVAELPQTTQVRLLRVLQTGEFIKVGSSKVQKIDVRVVAATNINLTEAIDRGRFREDLYYRLNTVPIVVPSLRDRKEDIYTLFRKFVSDISIQYRIPAITLDAASRGMLEDYYWPGNIRQLKNVAEQISVIEHLRDITSDILSKYLPNNSASKALVMAGGSKEQSYDYTLPILLELKKEILELKVMVAQLCGTKTVHQEGYVPSNQSLLTAYNPYSAEPQNVYTDVLEDIPEEVLTKEKVQREAIIKALKKHGYKRKEAAKELFISERTLYRRMKELNIKEQLSPEVY